MSDGLATRTVVQPMLRQICRLLDDIGAERSDVRHQLKALNALHLLRDALLDAEGIASLLVAAAAHRIELERRQIERMVFHGSLHDEYHDAARQVRAAAGAGIAQAKRLLNQTADVVDAFVAHGTTLRCRSFGSQVTSLAGVPLHGFDSRTDSIIALLRQRGPELDASTAFRDKFLEHAHPLRDRQQPRPASGYTALGFKEDGTGDEMALEDVVQSDFNWVKFVRQGQGSESTYVVAHVVIAGSRPGLAEVVRLDHEGLTGHFPSNDPHRHIFQLDAQHSQSELVNAVVGQSDLAQVQGAAVGYVADLLDVCGYRDQQPTSETQM
jgi:hypothetical protein